MKNLLGTAAVVLLLATATQAEAPLSGRWESVDAPVSAVLRFEPLDASVPGELDLPGFERMGIPLLEVSESEGLVKIRHASYEVRGKFELRQSGDALEGHWTFGAFETPIRFIRRDAPLPFRLEKLTFRSGDLTLTGHLFLPLTEGPHPALVFFHGSGDNTRDHYFYEAAFFAERGIAVLVPDKRGNYESEGRWIDVGFEELADDGIAGVEHLHTRPEIRKEHIGVIGISQACWIMPLAAVKSDKIKFIVAISGAMVNVEEEGIYDYVAALQDAGFGEAEQQQMRDLVLMDNQVSRGNKPMAEIVERVKELRTEPWYKASGFNPTPERMPWRAFYRRILDYDPMPQWEKVEVPVLFVYGMADKSVHAPTSIALLQPLLNDPARSWALHTFENADHGIRVSDGTPPEFPMQRHAPGYFEAMGKWVAAQTKRP